jgi:REP element-mobilizing transposase RayT
MSTTSKRRRHVQQSLFRRGGKRRGAGRKPKGTRAGVRHARRPEFKPYHPLHVVMRVVPAVGSLRRRLLYKAIRHATITAALRERIRIVHVSLQRNHVHMLVEADSKHALARGMQGFQISAARHINTALGDGARRRRGKVFADRYHVEVITSPTQAHHAIRYILCNWRKHKEDQVGLPRTWRVDPFSTGILFPDWKELHDQAWMWPIRDTYDPLLVRRPQCWLLREGWKKAGSISYDDVPHTSG